MKESEIIAAFKVFDSDKNGKLDKNEIRQFAKALGMNLSDDQVKEMISSIDIDGDGKVDIQEFARLVQDQ